MKIVIRLLSVILTICLFIPVVNVSSAETQRLLGDANNDGIVTISDVTALQRHIAQSETLDFESQAAGDVDASGNLNITDATTIQRFLAEMDVAYQINEPLSLYEKESSAALSALKNRLAQTKAAAGGKPVLICSYDTDDIHLSNSAYTYDNALAAMAFISAGDKDDAETILDAFVYVTEHDRYKPGRIRNAYLEIFFGHYGKSKKMIELLSEFESNGSSLLMKHRDHYSHSVYVFALGLAIYDTNENYRKAFQDFYGLSDDNKAAVVFLEYWGLSSLFHDIGYPFELPFEQVMAYYEVDRKNRKIDAPMIAYKDVSVLTKISEKAQAKLHEIYGSNFDDTCDLFAREINEKLYEQYKYKKDMREVLNTKPTNPEEFTYYMDHAWFSANRLFQELTNPIVTVIKHEGQEDEIIEDYSILNKMNEKHIDALTAIILHNSLYKFVVAGYYKTCKKQVRMEWHPLAYMLMLCDELQCWDRTAYGRNSRTELHPMAADFDFSGNKIAVTYSYDAKEIEKIRQFKVDYAEWINNGKDPEKEPTLKAYSGMWEKDNSFLTDIQHIVDTTQIPLSVDTSLREVDRKAKHTYLSVSNFLHLYDFAVALHNRYSTDTGNAADATVKMETEFESLSLEYQLSNINQAKHFSHLLNVIDCFYTDRPVDFEMVERFTPRQTAAIAPLEHRRWIHEHREMGWIYGDLYETCALPDVSDDEKDKLRKAYREQLRMHKLAMDGFPTDREIEMHYNDLPTSEQGKDIKPFNKMLELIKLYDGLRIYKLN